MSPVVGNSAVVSLAPSAPASFFPLPPSSSTPSSDPTDCTRSSRISPSSSHLPAPFSSPSRLPGSRAPEFAPGLSSPPPRARGRQDPPRRGRFTRSRGGTRARASSIYFSVSTNPRPPFAAAPSYLVCYVARFPSTSLFRCPPSLFIRTAREERDLPAGVLAPRFYLRPPVPTTCARAISLLLTFSTCSRRESSARPIHFRGTCSDEDARS